MKEKKRVIMVGAGILNATLGTFLNELSPEWKIDVFERLATPAQESSNEKNNAGTGHAALCELNYTVEETDGSIDIEKAKEINEQFEISKQFWSYLVKENLIEHPEEFIRPLPHISFVQGAKNVDFLKRRYLKMSADRMFNTMEYTEDKDVLNEWVPLMMHNRNDNEVVAASKINEGTDVNFGELTRKLMSHLTRSCNVNVHYSHEVIDFRQLNTGEWEVEVYDYNEHQIKFYISDYLIIGAGGNSIPMLQKTNIKESKHIGGFPISGAFLMCTDESIVNQHSAKVYGKEPEGTPPMTVPHLDLRHINGKKSLLFGPFAAIGPKFLKYGSNLDLFKSLKSHNLTTMIASGFKNLPLIQYSIEQVLMSKEDRMESLRRFVPNASGKDWKLIIAGKRVQIIKDSLVEGRGYIQFGTEVVVSEDHSVVGLLGESPGASTSVSVALEVLERNFKSYLNSWDSKLKEMIPSYGESLIENHDTLEKVRDNSNHYLKLDS